MEDKNKEKEKKANNMGECYSIISNITYSFDSRLLYILFQT